MSPQCWSRSDAVDAHIANEAFVQPAVIISEASVGDSPDWDKIESKSLEAITVITAPGAPGEIMP